MTQNNSAYQKSYGHNVTHAPDFERCCESVMTNNGGWFHTVQCSRKRGYGPGEAYCKQHDPAVVEARQKKTADEEERKYRQRCLEAAGPIFYRALCQIADGHDDPQTLAQQMIEGYRPMREIMESP